MFSSRRMPVCWPGTEGIEDGECDGGLAGLWCWGRLTPIRKYYLPVWSTEYLDKKCAASNRLWKHLRLKGCKLHL